MAFAISFNPATPKLYQSTTASVSGLANSTAYVASVTTPNGHTQKVQFATNGSGAATFPVVPGNSGAYTVTIYPAVAVSSGSGSFSTGGN